MSKKNYIIDQETGLKRYQHPGEPVKKSKKERNIWRVLELIPDSPEYPIDVKLDVLTTYATCGSLKKTHAKHPNVPYQTIAYWNKKDWWQGALDEVRKLLNDKLDGRLTGIMSKALDAMEERLERGDEVIDRNGQVVRRAVSFRDLSVAGVGVTYDKRALLRGEPTARIEQVSDQERFMKLANQFRKLAQTDNRIIDVTPDRVEYDSDNDDCGGDE